MGWVNMNRPCKYRHGWAWKGARERAISFQEACDYMRMGRTVGGKFYHTWSFGMGFNELRWETCRETGETCLVFNEYSENDLL